MIGLKGSNYLLVLKSFLGIYLPPERRLTKEMMAVPTVIHEIIIKEGNARMVVWTYPGIAGLNFRYMMENKTHLRGLVAVSISSVTSISQKQRRWKLPLTIWMKMHRCGSSNWKETGPESLGKNLNDSAIFDSARRFKATNWVNYLSCDR